MRRICILLTAILAFLVSAGRARAGYTFTSFDDPDGFPGTTHLTGIYGNTLVGTYALVANGYRSFIYSNGAFTTLRVPSSTSTPTAATFATGIWGNTVVGYYEPDSGTGSAHGFMYDGTSYATLDVPGAADTVITGISGNKVVGNYTDGNGNHGFVYDGHTFTQIIGPTGRADDAHIAGIDGDVVIGSYYTGLIHPFTFLGSAYTTPGDPAGAQGTYPSGISGSTWVGYYDDTLGQHGFVYSNSTYAKLSDPLAISGGSAGTYPSAISGTTIVGYYTGADGEHGFIATVAEPTSGAFLIAAGLPLLQRRRFQTHQYRSASVQVI